MKFDELLEKIEGIKDPFEKKRILRDAIIKLKEYLKILNEIRNHLDLESREDDSESG